MQFSYAQIDEALATAHGIPDHKRSAFLARIKHLQKLGFPPGVNTGRGRAAVYGIGQAFLLALGLELIQLGTNPERAINSIHRCIADVCHGVLIWADEAPKDSNQIFYVLAPAAISESFAAQHDLMLRPMDLVNVQTFIETADGLYPRLSLINLGLLLTGLHRRLAPDNETSQFKTALKSWAGETLENPEKTMGNWAGRADRSEVLHDGNS